MRTIKAALKRWVRPRPTGASAPLSPVERYLAGGRQPWSEGYLPYRQDHIHRVLQDRTLMERFRRNLTLPEGYGFRLDERSVEYPWVLSRLADSSAYLLDAGATLIYPELHAVPALAGKSLVVYSLEPGESKLHRRNVSYVCGDLRSTILKDGVFEEIVCLSTLEHIGMDNTFIYTADERYREARPHDFRLAVREFWRLLAPNGRLFITVPYGQYENMGWQQQFDGALVADVVQTFAGRLAGQAYYRYRPEGWQIAEADECRDCRYYNIHRTPQYDPDYAAAARAVACLELVKA